MRSKLVRQVRIQKTRSFCWKYLIASTGSRSTDKASPYRPGNGHLILESFAQAEWRMAMSHPLRSAWNLIMLS